MSEGILKLLTQLFASYASIYDWWFEMVRFLFLAAVLAQFLGYFAEALCSRGCQRPFSESIRKVRVNLTIFE